MWIHQKSALLLQCTLCTAQVVDFYDCLFGTVRVRMRRPAVRPATLDTGSDCRRRCKDWRRDASASRAEAVVAGLPAADDTRTGTSSWWRTRCGGAGHAGTTGARRTRLLHVHPAEWRHDQPVLNRQSVQDQRRPGRSDDPASRHRSPRRTTDYTFFLKRVPRVLN